MSEILEQIMKEKTSADHLMYVSMKYTKTCDVMINLLKRWKIMMDYSFDGILEKAKKQKMKGIPKKLPTAPKLKIDLVKEVFVDIPEIMDAVREYEMFKLIDVLKNTKAGEFRKGVCLTVIYKGEEVRVDLDKLKEYTAILETFITYTKQFLREK
jgi:hypothetical protein